MSPSSSGSNQPNDSRPSRPNRPDYKPPTKGDKMADVGGAIADVIGPWAKVAILIGVVVAVPVSGFALYRYVFGYGRHTGPSAEAADAQRREQVAAATTKLVEEALAAKNFDSAFLAISRAIQEGIADEARNTLQNQVDAAATEARSVPIAEARKQIKHRKWIEAKKQIDAARKICATDVPESDLRKLQNQVDDGLFQDGMKEAEAVFKAKNWPSAISLAGKLHAMPHTGNKDEEYSERITRTVAGRLQVTGNPPDAFLQIAGEDRGNAKDVLFGLQSGPLDVVASATGFLPTTLHLVIQPFPAITKAVIDLVPEVPGPTWAISSLESRCAQALAVAWYSHHLPSGLTGSAFAVLARPVKCPGFKPLKYTKLSDGRSILSETETGLPGGKKRFLLPDATKVDVNEADVVLQRDATPAESAAGWLHHVEQEVATDLRKSGGAAEAMDVLGAYVTQFPNSADAAMTKFATEITSFLASLEQACPTCLGASTLPCPDCNGHKHRAEVRPCTASGCKDGKKMCLACKGTRNIKCDACHGTGRTTVTVPSRGAFEQTREATCARCAGSGKRPCHTCGSTGFKQCTKCKGKGTANLDGPCSTCSGTGQMPCNECSRTGRRDHLKPGHRAELERSIAEAIKTTQDAH